MLFRKHSRALPVLGCRILPSLSHAHRAAMLCSSSSCVLCRAQQLLSTQCSAQEITNARGAAAEGHGGLHQVMAQSGAAGIAEPKMARLARMGSAHP